MTQKPSLGSCSGNLSLMTKLIQTKEEVRGEAGQTSGTRNRFASGRIAPGTQSLKKPSVISYDSEERRREIEEFRLCKMELMRPRASDQYHLWSLSSDPHSWSSVVQLGERNSGSRCRHWEQKNTLQAQAWKLGQNLRATTCQDLPQLVSGRSLCVLSSGVPPPTGSSRRCGRSQQPQRLVAPVHRLLHPLSQLKLLCLSLGREACSSGVLDKAPQSSPTSFWEAPRGNSNRLGWYLCPNVTSTFLTEAQALP